jgi:hypothetical protein
MPKPVFAKGAGNEPFTHHFGADFSSLNLLNIAFFVTA